MIPRAITRLFEGMLRSDASIEYTCKVSFVQLDVVERDP